MDLVNYGGDSNFTYNKIDWCTFCDDSTGFFTDGTDGLRCSMCQHKAAIQNNYLSIVPLVTSSAVFDKAVIELERMFAL